MMEEIRLIKRRYAERFRETADFGVSESVQDLISHLRSDGTWPDLDDTAPPLPGSVAGFRKLPHVYRLRKLAAASGNEEHAEVDQAIHRALAYWLRYTLEPQYLGAAPWFKQIGVPTQLAQMAILCEGILTAEEKKALVRLLQVAVRPDGELDFSGSPATGQNLVWEGNLQLLAGCLLEDARYIGQYACRIEKELQITLSEGLQPDFSFHQHGPQLYSGGYGQDFTEHCVRLIHVLSGTAFAFSETTVANIVSHILDGQQWMMRGARWDYGVVGRYLVRPLAGSPREECRGSLLARSCEELTPLAGQREKELLAFARRLRGEDPPHANLPIGCRLFWRSDYLVQVRRNYSVSTRMSSTRVIGTESSGNGQGLQNWHLGEGAMCLMRTGEEYTNIFPLWDWRKLPGVTCSYDPSKPLPLAVWGKGAKGGSAFAGGVTDGVTGVAAMELARSGVSARKASFFLEDCVLFLGAGIAGEDPSCPLVTGVNQCWAEGDIFTSAREKPLQKGESIALRGKSWIHHQGVTYLFSESSNVRVSRERKEEYWSTVNTWMQVADPVCGEVLSIWLEHPPGNETCSYVIAPDLSLAQLEAFRAKQMPSVLSNTPELQGISLGDFYQFVFWKAGSVVLSAEWQMTVDQPCAVQLRRSQGIWSIAAGNPTQLVRKLEIRLVNCRGQTIRSLFDFPEGALAGKSQIIQEKE